MKPTDEMIERIRNLVIGECVYPNDSSEDVFNVTMRLMQAEIDELAAALAESVKATLDIQLWSQRAATAINWFIMHPDCPKSALLEFKECINIYDDWKASQKEGGG